MNLFVNRVNSRAVLCALCSVLLSSLCAPSLLCASFFSILALPVFFMYLLYVRVYAVWFKIDILTVIVRLYLSVIKYGRRHLNPTLLCCKS